MYPLITPDYFPILDIYSNEKPDFLLPFFEAPILKRLADIDQNCWTHYCAFYAYKRKHVRLAHSLGVALIIRHFTHDEKQTLSWLFHDISHSIFSHVGDILLWDIENQEASEQYMDRLLSDDPIIIHELEKLKISIEEVDDYTRYPIADNHGPQLSADRLEYTLSSWLNLWNRTLEQINEIYNNIVVVTNEDGIPELWFTDKTLAKDFALLALQNDSNCFSSCKNTISMHFVAEILRKMLELEMITPSEMYKQTESEAIECIKNSWNVELIEMRRFYEQLWTYKTYAEKPESDLFVVSSKTKRRYIDPLVQIWSERARISALFPDFYEAKEAHINKKEEWISIDWKI